MFDRKAEQLASDPVFLKLAHCEHEIFHTCEYAEDTWNERISSAHLCRAFGVQSKVARKALENGYDRQNSEDGILRLIGTPKRKS
jgi:hypothetical protein